jgi:glutathione S-transferase
MLTIHHLEVSQSERIVWLCEELELDYELKIYRRHPETMMAPENYRALHPMGIAPIISDGEFLLAESGAIIEYIIARYGNGRFGASGEDLNFADYLFWVHFANATLMPIEMIVMVGGDSPLITAFEDRSKRAYTMMEQRLGETDYFAGNELSGADFNMFFVLTTMRHYVPRVLNDFPNIKKYLQRIGGRPAYKTAMAKCDADMPLLLE